MTDWLRRSLAPLAPEAWQEIDETAIRILKDGLSARTLVDVSGPHGFAMGAVNLGHLEIAKEKAPGNVPWGIRQTLPLVELRLPFKLTQMELDIISRGCKDADLAALEDAAGRLVLFEATALYKGFPAGHIEGVLKASSHKPIRLPADPEQYAEAVAEGIKTLDSAGVCGPYALVLGVEPYYTLMHAGRGGYPPRRIMRDLVSGGILRSVALDGGVLIATRGGDFELTIGQDISIGYTSHDRDSVELYLVESFTFRSLQPAAAIELKLAS